MTERIASSLVLSFDKYELVYLPFSLCFQCGDGWIRKKVHGVSSISKQIG